LILNKEEDQKSNGIPAAACGSKNQQEQRHISKAYGNSKLGQLWHAADLNRRLCYSADAETPPRWTAVCACPSWAATGIAGPDISGEKALKTFAFSTLPTSESEVAGPAVSSILNAMFLPTEELDTDLLTSRKLFGNTRVLDRWSGWDSDDDGVKLAPPLTEPSALLDSNLIEKWFGGRAIFCQTIARTIILFLQRFGHEELIIQPTSYECNNVIGQESLMEWSRQAVDEWINPEKEQENNDNEEEELQELLLV